jgi:toxin FitB
VVEFLRRERNLCVSVILFEELMFGLERAPQDRKARLNLFYEGVQTEFGSRALPITLDIARTSGRLRAHAQNHGRILSAADALIAATAMVHGATVVTRNVRDFAGLSVDLLDPFNPNDASI